jgi:hypothetical protein
MTAKVTLIGRPGKVVEHSDFVVTSMEQSSIPPLPKGIPAPKSPRMTYTLYIAAKQWRKVAEPLKVADDALIVEGVCVPDAESGGVALLVLSATTKALQRQKLALSPKGGQGSSSGGGSPAGAPSHAAATHAFGAGTRAFGAGATPAAPPGETAKDAQGVAGPAKAQAPAPSEESQVRSLLEKHVAGGKSLDALAKRSGLPLHRLEELHAGRATSLTSAQVRTILQKLKQALA